MFDNRTSPAAMEKGAIFTKRTRNLLDSPIELAPGGSLPQARRQGGHSKKALAGGFASIRGTHRREQHPHVATMTLDLPNSPPTRADVPANATAGTNPAA